MRAIAICLAMAATCHANLIGTPPAGVRAEIPPWAFQAPVLEGWVEMQFVSETGENAFITGGSFGHREEFDGPTDIEVWSYQSADWNLPQWRTDGSVTLVSTFDRIVWDEDGNVIETIPSLVVEGDLIRTTYGLRGDHGLGVVHAFDVVGATFVEWSLPDYIAFANVRQKVATQYVPSVPEPAVLGVLLFAALLFLVYWRLP